MRNQCPAAPHNPKIQRVLNDVGIAGCFSISTSETCFKTRYPVPLKKNKPNLGRTVMYNIQPCVEMGTLQHNPMWRSVLASDYTDRSLYLTVIVCRSRHIFALFLHCFHYPGVSVKNGCTIWYSVSLPCNVWRKPSTILFLFRNAPKYSATNINRQQTQQLASSQQRFQQL